MHRFSRTFVLSTLVVLAALAVAPSAAAKDGASAQLDTPLSLDAAPGAVLDVSWSIYSEDDLGRHPVTGSPVFLRFVAPDGARAEAPGNEQPAGSGHYSASLTVPPGGIAKVVVGVRESTCISTGCTAVDALFPLTDDPLAQGAVATAPAFALTSDAIPGLIVRVILALALVGVIIVRFLPNRFRQKWLGTS